MAYKVLGLVFLASILLLVTAPWALGRGKRVRIFYTGWFGLYACFIAWGTGPSATDVYPPWQTSPYRLPWQAGVQRFVPQGNRSTVSHRDMHLYAYDFWMPIGTEVLAAREGLVTHVEDGHDGIGTRSNYVRIEHSDGTSAMYAHLRRGGAVVKKGERVRQGQRVGFSGMVGQTLYPHLHFVVVGPREEPVPVTFADVKGGVPRAGRFYTSGNRLAALGDSIQQTQPMGSVEMPSKPGA